jgi:hypothetical protein
MGVDRAIPTTRGSYTAVPSNPVATGTASISGASGATVNLTWLTEGLFVYGTDDTAPLSLAVGRSNTLYAAGQYSLITAPAGAYMIGSQPTQFAQHNPGAITGASIHSTQFLLGPGVSGPLLSWQEAWYCSANGAIIQTATGSCVGPYAAEFEVQGNPTSTNTQNALVLYDRDDQARLRDLALNNLNGSALAVGLTSAITQAYLRESQLDNIQITESGNASQPALLLSSTCTTTCTGADATNEVYASSLSVYGSNGVGVAIDNREGQGATRLTRISGLRIESTTPGFDQLDIGSAAYNGQVSAIRIWGLEENAGPIGAWGVKLNAAASAYTPLDVQIAGLIGTTLGGGVDVEAGSSVAFTLGSVGSSATQVKVGASTLVFGPIKFDINGAESGLTTVIDPTAAKYVLWPVYASGVLGSAATGAVSAQVHNGSFPGGNALGLNAVDWQSSRYNLTQVASGAASTIGGGEANTASNGDSTVAGGSNNNASGYRGTVGGGYGNTASSQYATVPGGINNIAGSFYTHATGGYANASSLGENCHAGGDFTTQGDAQDCTVVFRQSTSGSAAIRLTADANAAGGANCGNIYANQQTLALTIDVIAKDITTSGKYAAWSSLAAILDRGASSSAMTLTTASSTPAATLSVGTLTGMGLSLTADTTNSCLNITWTPPTSNTDSWQVVARVRSVD